VEVIMTVANLPQVSAGSNLVPFEFEGSTLRTINQFGDPWFVAADVCRVLDHSDTSKAVSRLDDDERGTKIVRTPSCDQTMLVVNESGLYSLVMTSRKPAAKRFKKWVTSEVLPSIRKTGGYGAPIFDLSNPDHLLPLLAQYAEDKRRLTAENAAQAAELAIATRLAEGFMELMNADGDYKGAEVAKALGMSNRKLYDRLRRGALMWKNSTLPTVEGGKWGITTVLETINGRATSSPRFSPTCLDKLRLMARDGDLYLSPPVRSPRQRSQPVMMPMVPQSRN
jgi:prophage antirepressor-like protein